MGRAQSNSCLALRVVVVVNGSKINSRWASRSRYPGDEGEHERWDMETSGTGAAQHGQKEEVRWETADVSTTNKPGLLACKPQTEPSPELFRLLSMTKVEMDKRKRNVRLTSQNRSCHSGYFSPICLRPYNGIMFMPKPP